MLEYPQFSDASENVANLLFFGGTLSFDRLYDLTWTWESVRKLGAEAIASFFLGGFLNAIVLTPITYFIVLRIVRMRRRGKADREKFPSA